MNRDREPQELVWEEDPRYQNAQFYFPTRVLLAGFPLALLAGAFSESWQPLIYYCTVLGGFVFVFLLWLAVASIMALLLGGFFKLKDWLLRKG